MASSSDLITEGRRLLAAATVAPWGVDFHMHLEYGCRCLTCYDWATVFQTTNMLSCDDVPVPVGVDQERCKEVGYTAEDAELVAWARNNLERLLDIVEEARKLRRLDEVTVADHPDKVELNAYRDAMRDVRRILTDLGVTNPPPRLAALLQATEPKEKL